MRCVFRHAGRIIIIKYRVKGLWDVVAEMQFGEVSAISNRRPRYFDLIPGVNKDKVGILAFAPDSDADFLDLARLLLLTRRTCRR